MGIGYSMLSFVDLYMLLTDTTNIRDLLDKSNFNNFKELCDSSEPLLFNF